MAHSVDYYLSKGFDPKYAAYFAAGRRTVIDVSARDDFSLFLTFDNGEQRLYDMKPTLQPGTVFEPFMQIENFKRVYLDDCHAVCWDIDPSIDSSIHWNNKVDISPDTCYVEGIPTEK